MRSSALRPRLAPARCTALIAPRWTLSRRFQADHSAAPANTSHGQQRAGANWAWTAGRICGAVVPFALVFAAASRFAPAPHADATNDSSPESLPAVEIVQPGNPSATPQLGGPFTMTDCATGGRATDVDVLSAGKWSLLYFGFTKCAEVCPRNLAFMVGAVTGATEPAARSDVQIVFVSVDPLRDTAPVLRDYLTERVPAGVHWRGLVGSDAEVAAAARAWRVYYSSLSETDDERAAREAKGMSLATALGPANAHYQLDHSAAVYFVAPDGRLRDLFFDQMGPQHAASRIDLHLAGAYSGLNAPQKRAA
jgi:cytochrome oxidase Cu insertion factor (SCO1/SenC/PrrC family)